MNGYRVEYSADGNQICIIPYFTIPLDDFFALVKMYGDLGYKCWLTADERCGYIFAKEVRQDISTVR